MHRISAKIIDKGPFTDREAQVLRYMCEGFYSTEIALRLFRSPKTITKHIENIRHKLDAHCSSEVVLIARELGFVEVELINNHSEYILRTLLLLMLCNTLFPHDGTRRPPRTPRVQVQRIVRTCRQ